MGFAGHALPAPIGIETDHRLAFATALRGDEHYTVGCLCTIDGCRGGILQHVDALDVCRVERCDVTAHTVDEVERSAVAYGTEATDLHLHARTRLTRGRGDVHTRRLSLHGLQWVVGVEFLDVLALHLCRSAGEEFLLLDTVTYYDDLFESLVVLLKDNVEFRTSHLHFLCSEADVAEDEGLADSRIDGIVAIDVGNRAHSGTLHKNVGADNRFAVSLRSHHTRDCDRPALGPCQGRR